MKRSPAEVFRIYDSDPTMTVAGVARRIGGTKADYDYVWRLLHSRGKMRRTRDVAKTERNDEIRKHQSEGVTQVELARRHGISKQRVHQIVRGDGDS